VLKTGRRAYACVARRERVRKRQPKNCGSESLLELGMTKPGGPQPPTKRVKPSSSGQEALWTTLAVSLVEMPG
jgi:hypothetical protein